MKEVTATQAAALTGLSERTIRRRIAAGKLPARHIAPNRFAIEVRHLPRERVATGNLAARLEMLERRMQLLELQQQALLRRLDAVVATGEAGLEAGMEAGTEAGGDLGQLHEMLVQLAHETERLAPLLSGGMGSAARESPAAARAARGGKARKSAGA